MIWTAIVICEDYFSWAFSFCGPFDKRVAYEQAAKRVKEETEDNEPERFQVIALIPGDHPVYHPDSDE
jgi:hypothetical protein